MHRIPEIQRSIKMLIDGKVTPQQTLGHLKQVVGQILENNTNHPVAKLVGDTEWFDHELKRLEEGLA